MRNLPSRMQIRAVECPKGAKLGYLFRRYAMFALCYVCAMFDNFKRGHCRQFHDMKMTLYFQIKIIQFG